MIYNSQTDFGFQSIEIKLHHYAGLDSDIWFIILIIGDWNAKLGSQELPGVTGKLALEYRMKQGKG